MNVYAVREFGVNKIHGFFWAKNLDDLWLAVDEMADPVLFEYLKLKDRGGLWHTLDMQKVNETSHGNEDDEGFGIHPMGDMFSDITFGELVDRKGWVRFDSVFEGHGMLGQMRRKEATE